MNFHARKFDNSTKFITRDRVWVVHWRLMPVKSLRQELFCLSAQNFPSKLFLSTCAVCFRFKFFWIFFHWTRARLKAKLFVSLRSGFAFLSVLSELSYKRQLFCFHFTSVSMKIREKKSPRAGFLIDFGLRLRGTHRTKASCKHETEIMRVKSCVPLFHPATT